MNEQNEEQIRRLIRSYIDQIIHFLDYTQVEAENPPHFGCIKSVLSKNALEKLTEEIVQENSSYLNENCAICLSSFQPYDKVTFLKCSHIFHSSCIQKYLKEYDTKCCICKRNITDRVIYKLTEE